MRLFIALFFPLSALSLEISFRARGAPHASLKTTLMSRCYSWLARPPLLRRGERGLLSSWAPGSRGAGFGGGGSRCCLERGLGSRGARVQSLRGGWDLPRPGLDPVFPALAGRFFPTGPPREVPLRGFLTEGAAAHRGGVGVTRPEQGLQPARGGPGDKGQGRVPGQSPVTPLAGA